MNDCGAGWLDRASKSGWERAPVPQGRKTRRAAGPAVHFINMKTATALGLAFPLTLLGRRRGDRVSGAAWHLWVRLDKTQIEHNESAHPPDSGDKADILELSVSANTGLMHRTKQQLYSITSSARPRIVAG
jgi:hypothetical protein